jgi:hypothetical protein
MGPIPITAPQIEVAKNQVTAQEEATANHLLQAPPPVPAELRLKRLLMARILSHTMPGIILVKSHLIVVEIYEEDTLSQLKTMARRGKWFMKPVQRKVSLPKGLIYPYQGPLVHSEVLLITSHRWYQVPLDQQLMIIVKGHRHLFRELLLVAPRVMRAMEMLLIRTATRLIAVANRRALMRKEMSWDVSRTLEAMALPGTSITPPEVMKVS